MGENDNKVGEAKTIVDCLAEIVLKHIPTAAPASGDRAAALQHARQIQIADISAEHWFNATNDVHALEDFARALREARRAFERLSFSVRTGLAGFRHDALLRLMIHADLVEKEIPSLIKRECAKPIAGVKRNWRAAAVADACRTIWASEDWNRHTNGKFRWAWEPPSNMNALALPQDNESMMVRNIYCKWLEQQAPMSDKADAPGPFGRFLEDVMHCLGIAGRDGKLVSAASALRARRGARDQLRQK